MTFFNIVAIAVLSSCCTLFILWCVYRFLLRSRLETLFMQEMDSIRADFEKGLLETGEELIPDFRDALAEAFAEEAEAFLPEFRKEVSQGFKEAGEELLPEYRQEVQEAFEAALVQVLSGKLVEKTALTVAKTGTNLVGTGLDLLFGKSPGNRKSE